MNNYFYEIEVSALWNGAECKDIEVKFEKPSECAHIVCVYEDGKIWVEIPEDCNECVYAKVTCNDDECSICDRQQIVSICPCETSEDCDDCEECIDNMCVTICEEDEHCYMGICVECSPDVPCPENQICVAGKCQCPPDKPYLGSDGVCRECDDDHPCPKCHYCTDDGCKPIDCGTGVCDPETGECVECLGSGDCDGNNECCVDHKCVCCPGSHRDYDTGECVPDPDCVEDRDCLECEICYLGKCIPMECPEGFICIDGECVRECDCADPLCSRTEACISSIDPTQCYCVECEGSCVDNDDCEQEGCYCDGSECKPNPCSGPCKSGADCGEGCGCEDGECVPCSSLECINSTECEDVLGCGCVDNNCEDIGGGCSGDCVTSTDCGEGCGCDDGECVACADFSCEGDDCEDIPGCKCVGNNCEGDGGEGCSDSFKLEKDDENCTITATLSKEEDCACPKLTIDSKLSSVTALSNGTDYSISILAELRKGTVETANAVDLLPLLGNTSHQNIAENEKPISGTIAIYVTPEYREIDSGGNFVGFSEGLIEVTPATMDDKDQHTFSNISIPSIGKSVSASHTVHSVKVEIKQNSTLKFHNGCEYDSVVEVGSFTFTSNDDLEAISGGNALLKLDYTRFTEISSSDTRNPLITIFKSADGTYSSDDIMRKVYVPKDASGDYVDALMGPFNIYPKGLTSLQAPMGEAWPNRYYSATNDCSCDKDVDLGKVVFCNPTELNHEFLDCYKKIKINRPFEPCLANQDINGWDSNPPSDVQTKYTLYLNGVDKGTFIHNGSDMIIEGGTNTMFTTFGLNEPITLVELKMNHDTAGECTITIQNEGVVNIDVPYETDCDDVSSGDYTITVDKTVPISPTENAVITALTSTLNVQDNGTHFTIRAPKTVQSTFVATFASPYDGCDAEFKVSEDCCEGFSVDFTTNTDGCGGDLDLVTTVSRGLPPFTYVYTYVKPDNTVETTDPVSNTSGSHTHSVASTEYIAGEVSVTVTDSSNCGSIKETTTVSAQGLTFSASVNKTSFCTSVTEDVVFTFTGSTPSIVTGTIPNYPTFSLPGQSTIIIPSSSLSDGQVVGFTQIESMGCTQELTDFFTFTVSDSRVLTATRVGTGVICKDSVLEFLIIGPPNEYINYSVVKPDGNNSFSINIPLDSNGEAVVEVPTDIYGEYTLTVSFVNSSSCDINFNGTYAVAGHPDLEIDPLSYTCSVNGTLYQYSVAFQTDGTPTSDLGTITGSNGNYVLSGVANNTTATITASNGNCEITDTVIKDCRCEDTAVPDPTPAQSAYIFCEDENVPTMSVSLTAPAIKANWYASQAGGIALATDTPTYTPPEPNLSTLITYYVEGENNVGCTSDRIPITLFKSPKPVFTISSSDGPCAFSQMTYTANVVLPVSGNVTYFWEMLNSGTISGGSNNSSSVTITMPDVGDVVNLKLTVTDLDTGCQESYTETIPVFNCCSAPASITLQNDGDNMVSGQTTNLSTFSSICVVGFTDFVLEIFGTDIPTDATGTISYSGGIFGPSTFDRSISNSIPVSLNSLTDGSIYVMTIVYCNTSYVFTIVADCVDCNPSCTSQTVTVPCGVRVLEVVGDDGTVYSAVGITAVSCTSDAINFQVASALESDLNTGLGCPAGTLSVTVDPIVGTPTGEDCNNPSIVFTVNNSPVVLSHMRFMGNACTQNYNFDTIGC